MIYETIFIILLIIDGALLLTWQEFKEAKE